MPIKKINENYFKNQIGEKTLFFFIAKNVKRNLLYQSRQTLQENGIRFGKLTSTLEKEVRKIRLLQPLIKSSVMIGISTKPVDSEFLVNFIKNETPGLDFIGVFSKNQFFTKDRLKLCFFRKENLSHFLFYELVKAPQLVLTVLKALIKK
jgi:hypothetical protein